MARAGNHIDPADASKSCPSKSGSGLPCIESLDHSGIHRYASGYNKAPKPAPPAPAPPRRRPDLESESSDYWVIAIVVCSALFVLVTVFSQFFDWHWLYNLWFNYAWSSDKGNGPEALQQTVVYALAAALLIPVVRKFIAKHVADIKHSIHIHGTEITAHLHHITEAQGLPRFEHSDAYKAHIKAHEESR